jgi:hypothetical protein
MSDEFGNWDELSRLWHSHSSTIAPDEVARHARRQRRDTLALAVAEAVGLALAFIAAMWIAMHTAFVAMSAISMVFFSVSGYLHHRMRHEPEPGGARNLRSSLEDGVAREEWVLRQLGVGRAVTALTLASILLVGTDNLRFFATTPASRLWALLAITLIVLCTLAWNVALTRRARRRMERLCEFSRKLGA